jgi:hypothetical protein
MTGFPGGRGQTPGKELLADPARRSRETGTFLLGSRP